MSDDEVFEQLKAALGFDEDEEKTVERTRRELETITEMFKNVGLDEAEARVMAAEFLSGRLRYGSGRGGLHPEHVPELLQQAFFNQNLKRVVLDLSLGTDEYHLDMRILAVDEEVADQLAVVAKKTHARREKGEPS